MDAIKVPTTKGMGSAFGDYAYGAIGGLAFGLVRSLFGSGLIGSLAAPVLAGSIIKGERGTVIATAAGFLAFAGMGMATGGGNGGASQDVL